ncbi:MAG: hypothetical protein ABL862_03620 [Candidatus Nitrotoga sp.]
MFADISEVPFLILKKATVFSFALSGLHLRVQARVECHYND